MIRTVIEKYVLQQTIASFQFFVWRDLNLFEKVFYILLFLFSFSMILSIAIVQVICILMILTWLIRGCIDKRYRFISTKLDVPVILLIAVRTISIFTSVNLGMSITFFWKELPFYFLFFAFTQNININKPVLLRLSILLLILGGVIGALYGTIIHFTDNYARAHSITSGYMTLSMYLVAIIVLSLPITKYIIKNNLIIWIGIGLLSTGLMFTLGRIHIVIAVLAFIIFGIIKYRNLLYLIPVAIIIGLFLSPNLLNRMTSIFQGGFSQSDRGILWQDGITKIADNPLIGFGPYTFPIVFSNYDKLGDKKVSGWHNDFIQIYLESGIFALIAYLWIIIGSLWIVVSKIFREKKGWIKEFSIGLGAMLLSFYISSFFGDSAYDPITAQLFRFALALTALLSYSNGDYEARLS